MSCIDKGEKDINDVFDDLLLSEEKVIEKAYEEGFNKGINQGNPEGFHLGYHRGSEFGAELGYYAGVVETYMKYLEKAGTNERVHKTIDILNKLIKHFPIVNDHNADIIELMNEIRANFKKLCAQLKVNLSYPDLDELSF
ncbi:unnamed protein product [Brassicogethes aeneus]|uniref:Essential protein Yae1 N-terminal domain-containing protein n=1 Tax=Brassicogethes aeneus TaxID=1431903 RepID=A0A9P0FFX5_BRAAE|nr:unnamed protein product [Brassicogethes aeneus]